MANFSSQRGSEDSHVVIQPSRQEVINCAITSWYEQFVTVTFDSVFIPLSKDFTDYLLKDGCILPQGCSLPAVEADGTDCSSDEEEWTEDHTPSVQAPVFTEIVQCISKGIDNLGGAVLPKLNWSSPRDVVWMVPSNSLRCTCTAEVILLLKSSNFVTHDLTRVFEYCSLSTAAQPEEAFPYQLCLRKWEDIHPSSEFRCFVYAKQLIGICQRNHTTCYKHLLDLKENLCTEIAAFFDDIRGKFPNSNYVFDVCKVEEGKYWLVDFAPYCPMTDPLLFSWEELALGAQGLSSKVSDLPVIRLVDGETVQPSDLQTCRLPQDIVDITSGEDIHKFADLFLKGQLPGQDSDSD